MLLEQHHFLTRFQIYPDFHNIRIIMLRIFLVLFFLLLPFSAAAYEHPSTIVIGGEPGVVYIIGRIDPDLVERIISLDPTKIKRIDLSSGGGKLFAAFKIAEFVRKNNLKTYVGRNQVCASACTVIFQAGTIRTAHENAVFMYHYAYDRIGPKREKIVPNIKSTHVMFQKLIEYGVAPELIGKIKPGRDFDLTGLNDMLKYNIATEIEID